MGLELRIDYTEPVVGFVPPKFSRDASSFVNGIAKRVPTPAELRKARAELSNGEIALSMIAANWLYTNLRVAHPEKSKEWALAETYRRIPESNPANMEKYKPTLADISPHNLFI